MIKQNFLALKGATFPHLEVEGRNPELRDGLLNELKTMGVNDLRIRYFQSWTDSVFTELLEAVRSRGFRASIILSSCDQSPEANSLIKNGYPYHPDQSIAELKRHVLPMLAPFENIWGFDLRSAPFQKDPMQTSNESACHFEYAAEQSWLREIANFIHSYRRATSVQPYQVYVSLGREALDASLAHIELVKSFSDYIAIDYFFPRDDAWRNELGQFRFQGLVEADGRIDGNKVIRPFFRENFTEFMEEVKIAAGNLPILISRCGEHRNPEQPPNGKPWVTESDQAAWFTEFCSNLAAEADSQLHGVYLYHAGVKPNGYSVFEKTNGKHARRTACCDVIQDFFTASEGD